MERYNTYSAHLKKRFGEKVYKLPVNLPVTCPNRMEGRGCSFCAGVGTGFEAMSEEVPVRAQLEETKQKIGRRYGAKKFLAYFQNYTNTFLPLSDFKAYVLEALETEDIVGISVSTRPDCIREDYLKFLKEAVLDRGYAVTIELGLQTVNYHTLKSISRGHTLAEYLNAVLLTAPFGFEICTHVILNLPGDTMEDAVETARVVSALPVDVVKAHSLYIPKNSVMYEDYRDGKIVLCTKEEYLDRLTEFVANIREDMVIERLFSRVPEEDAVFSNWGVSWWKLKDLFDEKMEQKGYVQGCKCDYLNGAALRRWRI
ncbi:TIGR01212 family radical SAM protein [Anaerostipes sp.]|uniref:TIGR01212 family radical SAM protein n=1 Tax=Anaerostipes sp. TaxID=1872530 RepID=UPI0025BD64CE|nr:TIGR01212 family radical SAM protein [Anaerostipes sp.]MBS7008183.1 TIGR01212 family radical SAM protein [Anaerostipes sp.]